MKKTCLLVVAITIICNAFAYTKTDHSTHEINITPTPQEVYWGNEKQIVADNGQMPCRIDVRDKNTDTALLKSEFAKRIRKNFDTDVKFTGNCGLEVVFTINPADIAQRIDKYCLNTKVLGDQGYVLCSFAENGQNKVVIYGNSKTGLLYGMVTLVQLFEIQAQSLLLPDVTIIDHPLMKDRGLLVDLGGQGYMVGPSRWDLQQWKEFVDWMVDNKFNFIHLEFIGSGQMMGNLDMKKNEWAGFPVDLKCYPNIVCKDRPIRRWDEEKQAVVDDSYTAPNVEKEFVGELIEYCKERSIKTYLFIGYDYFAKQIKVVMDLPHNDPTHLGANKVYDDILREITAKYSNADGVMLCTIESMRAPKEMINVIIKRMHKAYDIIHSINPEMEIGLLADYLTWQENDLQQLKLLKDSLPEDFQLVWSPHSQPQQKSWQRVFGDILKYSNYSQYAWDDVVYVFPDRIQAEIARFYADGYKGLVSQAWYFSAFQVNYMAMAEYCWNLSACPVDYFWDKSMEKVFGADAKDFMRTALEHTNFDIRFDVIARQIATGKIDRMMTFWDMYVHHKSFIDTHNLEILKEDARISLMAAEAALPLAKESSKPVVQMTIISAKRRYYVATSALHLLKARQLKKNRRDDEAFAEMAKSLAEGEKLLAAARQLGIEYPMAVRDDEYVETLQEFDRQIKSGVNIDQKVKAPDEQSTPDD